MEEYKVKEHRGYTCKVYFDPDPTSPEDWNLLGTMYNQGRYRFQGHNMDEVVGLDEDGNWFVKPEYIFVRVYIYDHSGITIWSAREPQRTGWDSGLVGIYAVEKTKAEREYGDLSNPKNLENVLVCLESEVEEWDRYCRGEVYGYVVEDEDENEINSCWGFYCEPEEVMEEAISIANWYADKKEREEKEEAERIRLYEMVCEPFWID